MAAPAVESKTGTNPYVGPRSFQTGEHLYGRTREGTELLDLLIAERIVLLYSPSGAGKSSLINAVIIPGMKKEDFRVGPVLRINAEPPRELAGAPEFNRYAYSIISSLEASLPAAAQLPPGKLAGMKLKDYLTEYRNRAGGDAPDYTPTGALLLIFDQFEEILRISAADQEVKKAFFEQLGDLLRTDRSLWALIAIREDYLAAIEPYARPLPNRLSVTYRLDFLDARSAVEAIQGPARDSGVDFKEDAAIQLVDNLRKIRVQREDGSTEEQSGPYVEPVQLQVVCRRLWDKAAEKKVVTAADVSEAGNIDDALGDYYAEHVEKATKASGVGERQIREWFDRKLITPIGIRGNVLMEPESSGGLPNTTIKLLQEAYLVRADQRGNAIWFELAHDRLTRPIRRNNSEWFAQHLSVFQRQADFWQLQGKPESLILTGQAYLEAEEWVKEHPEVLTQPGPEKEFLDACRAEHRTMMRERRMNTIIRWASVGLLILTVAAVVLSVFAVDARNKADNARIEAQQAKRIAEQARIAALAAQDAAVQAQKDAEIRKNEADVRKLVALSVANLTVDPEVSVKLALEARQKLDAAGSDNAEVQREVEDALRRALPATRVEQVLTDPATAAAADVNHTFRSVSFDRTGGRIAVGSEDGSLRIWSTSIPGTLLKTIQVFKPGEGQPGITSAAFSPDGARLAATTGNGHVLIYNADSYALEDDVPVQTSALWTLAFNRDGTRLAVAGAGGLAQLWNLQDNANPLKLSTGEADVQSIAISPDGARIATGNADGVVVIWDSGTGSTVYPAIQAHKGPVSTVVFSPNGRELATAGADDRLINLWSLGNDARNRLTISGHPDSVNSLAFTRDGSTLISVSSDRTVRFWDTAFGRPGLVLSGHTDQVYAVALSPDGKRIASTGKDLSVRVWNISPEGSREYFTFSNGAAVQAIALSLDGGQVAAAGENGIVRITSALTGTPGVTLKGHTASVEAVVFSPTDKLIATASQDGTARIWNSVTGAEVKNLSGHSGPVWAVAFSPDGKLVATASGDGTVKIWDVASGEMKQDLKASFGPAYGVAFNQDGSLAAAGYGNSEIVLWDVRTGKQAAVLKGHTDAVRVVAFQPKGGLLASAGDDGSIRLWNMNSNPMGEAQASLRESGDAIFSLAFTTDGKHLFSGGAAGLGTLWDMEQRQADFFTYGQTDRIAGVTISPDGSLLYTGGRDGTVRLYVFGFDTLVELANKRRTREFTAEECYQLLNAACPNTTTAVVGGAPADASLLKPADTLPSGEAGMADFDAAGDNGLSRARYNDLYDLNIFERPFNADMSIYYPDIDIQSAQMSRDKDWMYFTITLGGARGSGLSGNYAIELDMNGDGRGDHLITSLAPAAEWSTGGVRIWEDKNRDVGNNLVYRPDGPQTGDGYETLVFDQGSGDGPDLAWVRISPNDPNQVQFALQRKVVETDGREDESFVWLAWASRDSFQPAWFDYNDHFSRSEVGAPVPGKAESGSPVLQNLPGLDNTCHYAFGVNGQGDLFCKQ